MKLGIVILNYNTYDMTMNLIKQINMLIKHFDYYLIVVDNASTNESVEYLENFDESFIFLKNDNNSGYASGNNIGIKNAVGLGCDYVLVMNNDIDMVSEDVVDSMISIMNNNQVIAAVSPRIVDAEGKADPPIYFRKPTFIDLSFGMMKFQKERFRFDESKNCRVYAPRGSFMLLRSSAIEKINYLDENTFLYYEEPILAEKLSEIGLECWHCGNVQVIHNHAVTIKKSYQKKQISNILIHSYRYYLREYRHYNRLKIYICLFFRKLALLRR